VSTVEQKTLDESGLIVSGLPFFLVSFALDHSSEVRVAHIESPDAAGVFDGMKQQFPSTYEYMSINAIVESRQSDGLKTTE
jgi:hypothetical protein